MIVFHMNRRERRESALRERRSMPRGGRRAYDLPGRYPPVLVAERYEPVRTPGAAYLNLLQVEVAEVARPTEAVAIIAGGWLPHVILADSTSADSLTSYLATSALLARPQLIVMTGSPELPRSRSTALLTKPFRLKTMAQAVRRAVRRAARLSASARNPLGPHS